MTKRKCLAVASVVAALVLAAFALRPRPVRPGVTRENFDRIRTGMTLAETKAILGRPWHIGGHGPWWSADVGWMSDGWPDDPNPARVELHFGRSGLVEWKESNLFQVREPSLADDLLWRAKRRWRERFTARERPVVAQAFD